MQLKLDKFGEHWKIPLFTIISLIPLCSLQEESWFFWIPYFITFGVFVCINKKFGDYSVLLLTILGIPIGIIHYQFIAKIDLLFFARLLLFIQLGLHLIPITPSSATAIFFINFVLVLVAAALTFEFWFALYLIIFLLITIYMILELQFLGFKQLPKFKDHFKYSTKLTLFLVLCSYFMFLITPRLRFDRFPSQISNSISGFSDTVSFNDFTNILTSDKVAMRVKTDYPPTYYRGISLDKYDGSNWRNTSRFKLLRKKSLNNFQALDLPISFPKIPSDKIRTFQFQLLPSKNKYLLLPQHAQSIEILPPVIEVNEHGDVRKLHALTKNLEYKVYSGTPPNKKKQLESSPEIEPYIYENYLQLPEVSSAVRKLSQKITINTSGYWEKVNSILKSFRLRGYKYSLRSSHTGNPLESFLLNNKVGHCQYFAGAMVLLLRLNGVPSRLVNGFTTGDYNEWGDYYTVRYKHAHSWVEVYAGNGIWVIKDPTPPANRTFLRLRFLSDIYSQWKKIQELLDFKWQEYILYFSLLDQQLIWISFKDWFLKNPILNGLLIIFTFTLSLKSFRYFFESFEQNFTAKSKLVRKFDRLISSLGHDRPMNVGILEFVETLQIDTKVRDQLIMTAKVLNKITFANENRIKSDALEKKFYKLIKKTQSISKI